MEIPLKFNGHIDQRKLFERLYHRTSKLQVKSDVKPTAPTNILCTAGNEWLRNPDAISSVLVQAKKKDIYLWRIILLLSSYGMRISEVLNIQYHEITAHGSIILKSLKNSNDRIIVISEIKEYLLLCRANGINPFDAYNRWYCYREFQKLGISFSSPLSTKKSVTHAFRHIVVADLRAQNLNNAEIARYMGHKNEKNIDYYGK